MGAVHSDPDDALEVRDRVVSKGLLSRTSADQALDGYRDGPQRAGFETYLLEQGFIGLEELDALDAETDVDGEAPTAPVGQRVAGCQLLQPLQGGAMGSVYRARREEDGLDVVVKFLAPELAVSANSRARFLGTAELVQDLEHPNVARVLSVHPEVDPPCVVMELARGLSLRARLARDGPLAIPAALGIARDVAAALVAAHAHGILHRDVKPENVLVADDGEVKLIDFGLGKNLRQDAGLSFAGQVLGTPYYMAPEQWGEHEVDARCDVFSLGATLYHLVTGTLPFRGTTPLEVARQVVHGRYRPPRELREDLSEDAELVLFRMLEPDRDYRYPSMQACLADLERLLAGDPPDVPRLEGTGKLAGFRLPLLPGALFRVGRQSTNELQVKHATVSREHAELRREAGGYVLRDVGSSHGTRVGDQPVREVQLKHGDSIRFGQVRFLFRAGEGHADVSTGSFAGLAARTVAPLLEALVAEGDRRVVLHLIERLVPGGVKERVRQAEAALSPALGGEAAAAVGLQLGAALQRAARRAGQQLFSTTREKLGVDPETWLGWWVGAGAGYPPQVGGPLPPGLRDLTLRDQATGQGFPLVGGGPFRVGREEGCTVLLDDPTASRLHATILRLDRQLVIRDEGSRMGTLINGRRVLAGFLQPGDRLGLGKAELVLEHLPADEPLPGPLWLESAAFAALVETRPDAAALGLVQLLAPERRGWLPERAAELSPDDPASAERLAEAAQDLLDRWARVADELLPGLLDGAAPEDWPAAIQRALPGLPPQALPVGWGLAGEPPPRVRLRRPPGA